MPRFTANLSVLFTDHAFLDRFEAARAAGFSAVEIPFPYEHCLFTMKRKLRDCGLELAVINLPAGKPSLGDRGIAALPDRQEEFRAGVETGIRWARELGVTHVNCVAGFRDVRYSVEEQLMALKQNIEYAAGQLVKHGITLMLETVSCCPSEDFLPGSFQQALKLLEQIKAKNLRLLLKMCQEKCGNVKTLTVLRQHRRTVGHIHFTSSIGFRHGPCEYIPECRLSCWPGRVMENLECEAGR